MAKEKTDVGREAQEDEAAAADLGPLKERTRVVLRMASRSLLWVAVLVLTFPLWIAVNYLGEPDNGVIALSYLGSWVMAGAFIAIGACMSALSKNQVIAFVLAAAACLLFLMSGVDLVLAAFRPWAPQLVVDTVASFSFITHFAELMKGVVSLATVLFFASLVALCLVANTLLVDLKKAA